MMMMNQPDDNLFQDLLSDYAAPIAEDGFSDAIMKRVDADARKVEHIRRFSIYGACFIGGVIAASQFPALLGMATKINLALPEVPSTGTIPPLQWIWVAPVLLGFVLWAALDRKASDIF